MPALRPAARIAPRRCRMSERRSRSSDRPRRRSGPRRTPCRGRPGDSSADRTDPRPGRRTERRRYISGNAGNDAPGDRIGAAGLTGGVEHRLHPVSSGQLVSGNRRFLLRGSGRVRAREVGARAAGRRFPTTQSTSDPGSAARALRRTGREAHRELEAAVRPARRTRAERLARLAVRFDEVLLAHHRRFAREDRIAVVRRVLQGVAEERVPFTEPRG